MIVDTMNVLFVSKQVNGCQGDGFSSVGARMGTLKLAMAWYLDWWHRFPPLSGN